MPFLVIGSEMSLHLGSLEQVSLYISTYRGKKTMTLSRFHCISTHIGRKKTMTLSRFHCISTHTGARRLYDFKQVSLYINTYRGKKTVWLKADFTVYKHIREGRLFHYILFQAYFQRCTDLTSLTLWVAGESDCVTNMGCILMMCVFPQTATKCTGLLFHWQATNSIAQTCRGTGLYHRYRLQTVAGVFPET